MKIISKKLFYIGVLLMSLSIVAIRPYWFLPKNFGNPPSGKNFEIVKSSPNYKNGEFKNLEETQLMTGDDGGRAAMKEFFFGSRKKLIPNHKLHVVNTDIKKLDRSKDVVLWFGHSSFMLQLGSKRILVDPVFSPYASPFFFINKAFDADYAYKAEMIPDVDYVVISHDHWDHLDYATMMALKDRVKAVICPLGVGSHLRYLGFAENQIIEMDWNQSQKLDESLIINTLPARHFSGRGLTKPNQTLWASYMFVSNERKVFYSGDSGYGKHFAEIGNKFGSIDLAILEDGQYNGAWAQIHMLPEEVAKAADDLKTKTLLPVHNSKFAISLHSWDDPMNRIYEASVNKKYKLLTPQVGEILNIDKDNINFKTWWK